MGADVDHVLLNNLERLAALAGDNAARNASYLAAVTPETILALVDALRDAWKRSDELVGYLWQCKRDIGALIELGTGD